MEACPKETRAPQPNRPRRDEPLSRRQGRDGGGSEELARSKSHGVPEPSHHDGSRSSESGASNDSRASDFVDGSGSSDGGASGACQRHLDTTAEGLRDIPVGRRMVDSKALGDHTADHRHAGAAGREGARHQAGAACPEDERGPQEGRSLQVGVRQRTRSKPGKVRESQPSKGRHCREIESSSTDRGPTYRGKGYLQRSRHSPSQGRSGREEGSQPRPKARGIKRGPAGRNRGDSPVTKRTKGRVLEEDQGQAEAGRPEWGAPSSSGRGVKLRSRSPASGDEVTSGKVKEIMAWLTENEGEHLSAAQMSQYLLLQAVQLNGPFGRLIESSLKPTWEQSHRVRNLMPLPLWPDVIRAMEEVIESQRYKAKQGEWRSRGNTKTKASRALRNQGLLLWHGLTVVGLNWMHSGGNLAEGVAQPAGRATSQQENALCRIWDMVKTFVEEKPKRGGVPRTPQGGWDAELEKLKVSYTGEVVEKARPLTLEQILPGLPSAEHGGLVNILDVVDEKMKDKLSRPDLMLREVSEPIPQPQVLCGDEEWEKVVQALHERHLVSPVTTKPSVGGVPVLNGAFGVIKPDRMTESGLPVLRMIFDLRASNTILEQLEGDVRTLTGAASFQKLMLGHEDQLLVSGDDLTAAFYLFRLPPDWAKYLVLRKLVRRSLFEPGRSGETLVGINVLPMGWSSAVAIMQCAHRQLALRTELRFGAALHEKAEIRKDAVFPSLEESPAWAIYLDDTTILEKVSKEVARSLEGLPPDEQLRLRRAYEWWGIPTNAGKALERSRCAESLGALLDGEKGLLRVTTKRSLDLMSLGAWLRQKGSFATTALQVYAGKAVHILQFRRCLFSVMQEIFSSIAHSKDRVSATTSLYDEMMVLESLLPLVMTHLKAGIDPVVTASDASEAGGGACYASRLSRLGEEELEKLMEEEQKQGEPPSSDFRDVPQKIIVIDLFAGIGGLERALELAEVKPWFTVAVEADSDCRRCLKRRFPGMEFCTDIRKVDKEMVQRWLRSVHDANGVIVGGVVPARGSPGCQ